MDAKLYDLYYNIKTYLKTNSKPLKFRNNAYIIIIQTNNLVLLKETCSLARVIYKSASSNSSLIEFIKVLEERSLIDSCLLVFNTYLETRFKYSKDNKDLFPFNKDLFFQLTSIFTNIKEESSIFYFYNEKYKIVLNNSGIIIKVIKGINYRTYFKYGTTFKDIKSFIEDICLIDIKECSVFPKYLSISKYLPTCLEKEFPENSINGC